MNFSTAYGEMAECMMLYTTLYTTKYRYDCTVCAASSLFEAFSEEMMGGLHKVGR